MLASPCVLNAASRSAVASAAIASKSAGEGWPADAKAQTVLARPCAEKSASSGIAAAAMASKSSEVAGLEALVLSPALLVARAVAKAHARLERPCVSNCSSLGAAARAIAS